MTSNDQKTLQILEGAFTVFSRYGLRKTTMLDIAQTAGISRAALYLRFKSKEEVFRALSAQLHDQALQAVDTALAESNSLIPRLEKALVAFALGLMKPIDASPHGQELFDANLALASDISNNTKIRLLAQLQHTLANADTAGEIRLANIQTSASELAALILATLDGIKHAEPTLSHITPRLALFMRLLDNALQPPSERS